MTFIAYSFVCGDYICVEPGLQKCTAVTAATDDSQLLNAFSTEPSCRDEHSVTHSDFR